MKHALKLLSVVSLLALLATPQAHAQDPASGTQGKPHTTPAVDPKLHEEIKSLQEKIRAEREKIKPVTDQIKSLREKIKPQLEQIKADHAKLKELRQKAKGQAEAGREQRQARVREKLEAIKNKSGTAAQQEPDDAGEENPKE